MDAKMTGKIISSKRKEKGLTQIQLAERLNVSNRAVSKWENGDGFPDITLLPLISKELDITIDELLTGQKPEPVIKAIEKNENENKSRKLINDFKICFVASIFFAVFAALLGSITELYSIWAFPSILFYTHWEIMFAALSLVALAAGGLVFVVGLTRLHLEYSKKEILILAADKAFVLASISVIFPIMFLARIIDVSRWGNYTPYAMSIIIAAVIFLMVKAHKKIKDIKNENNQQNN